jgi:hypothetical protein
MIIGLQTMGYTYAIPACKAMSKAILLAKTVLGRKPAARTYIVLKPRIA